MLRTTTQPSDRRALQGWMPPPPFVKNSEMVGRDFGAKLFADYPGSAAGSGLLTPEAETHAFKQLHYAAYRLSRLYRAADRSSRVTTRKIYTAWVERYHALRSRLTQGNLGLVYDLLGRSRFTKLEREDLTSEGMMALLRAVDSFDPWRGYRFSTYACNAILRAFSRAAKLESRRRTKAVFPFDPNFEISDVQDHRKADRQGLAIERMQHVLQEGRADLTAVEQVVLAQRFPMRENREPLTLEEIGRRIRVSKERVRQIQLSAIRKLRHALKSDLVLQ